MAGRKLGQDIVALVQHVELNESGWIDAAAVKAVKFLFWLLSSPATRDQIFDERADAGLAAMSRAQVDQAIDVLVQNGGVVELPDGTHKLSDNEAAAVQNAVASAGQIEAAVKVRVLAAATNAGADCGGEQGNQLWGRFHSEFVAPFIREFGARAYELITGVSTDAQRTQFITEFLTKFPEGQRAVLEPMILALLDRNDVGCRTYVLRLLNSYFFHSALSLPNEVIERAFSRPDRQRNIRLVLDTNFLFSLFELHANPSNEAVSLLLKTISRVPKNLNIRMYVLPTTVAEFRRTLVSYENQASSIIASRGVVSAALRVDISGVLQTYFRKVQESKYELTAKEYFEPYHSNIRALLEQHNVSILHGEDDKYSTDQETIDDITDQLSFYQRRFINEPRRQKSYEQVTHDMVLWHFISDRRPNISDTIFDAEWVGVTIDFGLMAFDEHKRKRRGIPCMVHPASLVQALQMMIPTDENLERTIVALMQMPFMFEPFNLEDEKITRHILGTLSHFEGAGNLTSETIIDILGNKALRGKFERSQERKEEVELIRDALIEHTAELERKAADLARRIETKELELREVREDHEQKRLSESEKMGELHAERSQARAELERANARAAATEQELTRLQADLESIKNRESAREKAELRDKEIKRVAYASIVLMLWIFVVTLGVYLYAPRIVEISNKLVPWGIEATIVVLGLRRYKNYIGQFGVISNRNSYKLLSWTLQYTWAVYLFLFTSIVPPLIYDTVKGAGPTANATNAVSSSVDAKGK